MKQPRIMPIGMQVHTIRRMLASRHEDPQAFDPYYVDPKLHLDENIQMLRDQGIIKETQEEIDAKIRQMEDLVELMQEEEPNWKDPDDYKEPKYHWYHIPIQYYY